MRQFSRHISARLVGASSSSLLTSKVFNTNGAATTDESNNGKPEAPNGGNKDEKLLDKEDNNKHAVRLGELEKELKETKTKMTELKSQMLYVAADAENARRIGREDTEKARSYGISTFGKDMLDVSDTLEKAVEAFAKLESRELEQNKILASIFTGVKMSNTVLLKHLSKHGIEKMDVKVGQKFDPNRHEALFKSPASAEVPEDHISNVVKGGYTIKERVLRAAQVGVSEKQ